ncbi:MAG: hypothetical protein ACR2K5_08800 [Pseudolabrys sp.]
MAPPVMIATRPSSRAIGFPARRQGEIALAFEYVYQIYTSIPTTLSAIARGSELGPRLHKDADPATTVRRLKSMREDSMTGNLMSVGLTTGYREAEDIIASGKAAIIALGRGAMHDPRWPLHAAERLGVDIRCASRMLASHSKLRPNRTAPPA